MPQRTDLIESYLSYIGDTEAPVTFHRWCCLAIIGAWLGRRYYLRHGHFTVNSNLYVMLMGSAGSRKSTAIKIASSVLRKAGYDRIAAERTTKEKFLMDMAGLDATVDTKSILEKNLFGAADDEVAEILIAADEFNTFVGNGNIEFLSLLGVLWDYSGPFEDRKKNSKSFIIHDPTVSILAGNTATGFSLAFPAEAIGQGIFSRLLLVHGEKTDRRIPFPVPPDSSVERLVIDVFHAVRQVAIGEATLGVGAEKLLGEIYVKWKGISDVRFDSYANRRFSQLLKLCLIASASALRNIVEVDDVIYANTILTHAEHSMPKALGEFGKSRNSDVVHKVITVLESSYIPVTLKQLWKHVHNDLKDLDELKSIVSNLQIADKIMSVKEGLLIRREMIEEASTEFTDFSLLTPEERKYLP